MPKFCGSCGAKNDTEKFCTSCGTKLDAGGAAAASKASSGGGGEGKEVAGARAAVQGGPQVADLARTCDHCGQIPTGSRMTACNKVYCVPHFKCTNCSIPFAGPNKQPFYEWEKRPYCKTHYLELANGACGICGQLISDPTVQKVLDKTYHWKCFVCCVGPHEFKDGDSNHYLENKVYCALHYEDQFRVKCSVCTKPIREDAYMSIGDKKMHYGCWQCRCGAKLKPGQMPRLWKGVWLCPKCYGEEEEKAAAAARAGAYKVGDRVFVKQDNGELWPGTITAVLGNGLYEVEYDNGELGHKIPEHLLSHIPKDSPDYEKGNGRWGKKGSAEFDGYVNEDDELAHYIGEPYYPYERLKPSTNCPPHINGGPLKAKFREQHLDDDVFRRIFGMDKQEFRKLQEWRRHRLKRNAGLF